MPVTHYSDAQNAPVDEIVFLFITVDEFAAGRTYRDSTVDMSRAMFFQGDQNVPKQKALRAFYNEFSEEVVIYQETEDGPILGFTMFESGQPQFEEELPTYQPHIAITFSGVHPDHQKEGIWTALRDEIRRVARERGTEYILTGVDKENDVSLQANKNRGLDIVGQTGDVEGTDTTLLLARRVSGKENTEEDESRERP